MAGLLASLLPGAISGIAKFSEGLGRGKSFGEALGGGLRAFTGAPDATDFMTTEADIQRMKQLPMKSIETLSMNGVPRVIRKRVPIAAGTERPISDSARITFLESDLDDLDDKIDEILGSMKDKAESLRLDGEIAKLEDLAEESFPEDEMKAIEKEIELKLDFVKRLESGTGRRRRRRNRFRL